MQRPTAVGILMHRQPFEPQSHGPFGPVGPSFATNDVVADPRIAAGEHRAGLHYTRSKIVHFRRRRRGDEPQAASFLSSGLGLLGGFCFHNDRRFFDGGRRWLSWHSFGSPPRPVARRWPRSIRKSACEHERLPPRLVEEPQPERDDDQKVNHAC